MNLAERIQRKIDRGMTEEMAIQDEARLEYFRQCYIADMNDEEYTAYLQKQERPLLDWIETNDS